MEQSPQVHGGQAVADDVHDRGYGSTRRADPRILQRIAKAVGGAPSVVNIGAGTGAYEPPNRRVVAVEPSDRVIAQRRTGAAPVVKASAEALPFRDDGYSAAMAILTIHHWEDPLAGLREMRRVARRRAVVLTLDPAAVDSFWLYEYFPAVARADARRFPPLDVVTRTLGGDVRVEVVPIPHDCRDGILGAYWRRPSLYLASHVRRSISTLAAVGDDALLDGLALLSEDLRMGAWDAANSWLLDRDELDLGYRLVVAEYGDPPNG
jgi:SAM-dependent methyltransferase